MAQLSLAGPLLELFLDAFGPSEPVVPDHVKSTATSLEERYIDLAVREGCPCLFCYDCDFDDCTVHHCKFDSSHGCGCVDCTYLISYLRYLYQRHKAVHSFTEFIRACQS